MKKLVLVIVLLLSACAPAMTNRGHLVDADKLAQLSVGTSTRDDVANVLGTPTYVADFDENTWYYVGQTTEQTAFFRPDVAAHTSVRIRFGDDGKVTAIDNLNSAPRASLDPETERTPTLGRENSLFQELFGGIGRPGLPGGRNNRGPGQ
ncbi:MAG: outer membrane protein assembly factor BamE [Alphaproteobacteria bacterium]|nr:outer membrane protein assembly factor BamE [Alphaproteobacteria bacterium]NDC55729.1 outer membrane protein assembly factor BamE [Alphaproteobacteria bacterium]NDG04060.1 outer membrane protein assembly factor BamE [Alphaproteobacteria bacterium]